MDARINRDELANFYDSEGLVTKHGESLAVYRPVNGDLRYITSHRFADDGLLDLFVAIESVILWDEALALGLANAFRSENHN